jgi:hypothetical protein
MKKSILFGSALVMSVLMFSCKKESPTPVKGENSSSIGAFFSNNRADQTQSFTVNSSQYQTIKGTNGTVVKFAPNTFVTPSGQAVTGNLKVELLEVLDKSSMILNGVATESNGQMIISGGELKLTVSQNGENLVVANGFNGPEVYVPTNQSDPNMDLFVGSEDADGDVTWTITDSLNINSTTGDSLNFSDSSVVWDYPAYYYFDFNTPSLGWINCDFFWDNPDTKITINAEASEAKFNVENTVFYIVYDNYNSVGQMSDYDDDGIFSQTEIPVNLDITIVAISEIDGQFHYGEFPATTVDDQIYSVTLLPVTASELQANIDAL